MVAVTSGNKLYDDIVTVTRVYLGPAAERFIDRQVQAHLHKESSELKPADVAVLTQWSKLALALLTDDPEEVKSYTKHLMELSKQP